jgi:hypothetical protein
MLVWLLSRKVLVVVFLRVAMTLGFATGADLGVVFGVGDVANPAPENSQLALVDRSPMTSTARQWRQGNALEQE